MVGRSHVNYYSFVLTEMQLFLLRLNVKKAANKLLLKSITIKQYYSITKKKKVMLR